MSVSLGSVSAALLAVGHSPHGATTALAAKMLGYILMPVAIAFSIYAGKLYMDRRELLRQNDLYNPDMHVTKTPVMLGYLLFIALGIIFILDLSGEVVKL